MHVRVTTSPRTILFELTLDSRASASVKRQATELMGRLVENRWPPVRRQSRESSLKAIAGDESVRPKIRLQALKDLLFPTEPTAEEKASLARMQGNASA